MALLKRAADADTELSNLKQNLKLAKLRAKANETAVKNENQQNSIQNIKLAKQNLKR